MSKIPKQLKMALYEKLDLYAKLQDRIKLAEKFDMPEIASNCVEAMSPIVNEIERLKREIKNYA